MSAENPNRLETMRTRQKSPLHQQLRTVIEDKLHEVNSKIQNGDSTIETSMDFSNLYVDHVKLRAVTYDSQQFTDKYLTPDSEGQA